MKYHKNLTLEKWSQMPLAERLANVGSEVERALKWREKGNAQYSEIAVERALELLNLTIQTLTTYSKIKECARCREVFLDYFYGDNYYQSTPEQWRKYFNQFNFLARNPKYRETMNRGEE